jgi:uncharacterized delta-60 repeat protein
MWNIFSPLAPKRRVQAARSRSFRPHVEALEGRYCLSPGVMEWSDPFGGGAMAVAVQPDGKIVTVGTVNVPTKHNANSSDEIAVTRINPNDTLDTTFGTGGTVALLLGTDSSGTTIAIQPDGKILVAGDVFTQTQHPTGYPSDQEYAVARLNSNGTMDKTFGGSNTGWWTANPTSNFETVKKVAVVPSGTGFSIYVGGESASSTGLYSFVVVKLTSAGRPDTTYGTSGFASQQLVSGVINTFGLAVTPAGEAFVVGNYYLLAFNPVGQPDTNFNGTGYVNTQVTTPTGTIDIGLRAVGIQGDKVVVAGQYFIAGVANQGYVARYTMAGALDPTFGIGGSYLTPPALAPIALFTDMAIAADGSIALVGWINRPNPSGTPTYLSNMLLGRLTADGAADTSFGTDGTGLVVGPDLTGTTYGKSVSLTLDASGNFLVSGPYDPNNYYSQGYVLLFSGS